jgi:hypothetical protein
MVVHPHGGVTRRSGTVFVQEAKTSADKARLVRFEFSIDQAYILEFGDNYLRIYLNQGRLESGGSPVEVVTPYADTELSALKWLQSNDVLYLFHPDHKVRQLVRSAATTWVMSVKETEDGPYLSVGQKSDGVLTTELNVQSAAATGTGVTLTASDDLFASTDVGRLFRMKVGSDDWGWGRIASYVSATEVTWDIESTVTTDTTNTNQWRLGLFSDTTGWPSTGSFHEQRLCVAGASKFPSTLALSVNGDFFNFKPSDLDDTVADDSGLTYTLATDTVVGVFWIRSGKRLRVGTSSGEFILWSGSNESPITPTNVIVSPESSYGSLENVSPALVGKDVLFVGRTGRKVRNMEYVFENDGFDAPDLTLLSEDITIGKVVEIAYQENPDNILWCRLDTGKLIGLTYVKEQDVIAWHEHQLGGSFSGGPPVVESIQVIPDQNGEYDELWMVVKRTINGNTVRYIEYMERTFDEDITLTNARLLDSLLVYSGASTTTISGLDHLEGEDVRVVAAGVDRGTYTVSSGSITLTKSVTTAYVGLMYNNYLQSLRFEGGGRMGVAQGRLTRAHEVTVRFNRTLGGKIGYSATSTLETVFERNAADPMGSPPSLFTGDKIVNFPQGHELGLEVYVLQDQPLPMTVLSMMPDFSVEEGV